MQNTPTSNQAGKLNPGDIVQLKSGGPHMTIQALSDPRTVTCAWFTNNTVTFADFSLVSLKVPDKSNF